MPLTIASMVHLRYGIIWIGASGFYLLDRFQLPCLELHGEMCGTDDPASAMGPSPLYILHACRAEEGSAEVCQIRGD